MSAPAAIRATFADYKRIRTRKLGQLIFEVPLEQLHEAIASLGGEPGVDTDTWVGIALLQEPKTKWAPERTNPSKECALTCQKPTFWEFLAEDQNTRCENEEDAATYVRTFCKINTRADLATNRQAFDRWSLLLSAYEVWMEAA